MPDKTPYQGNSILSKDPRATTLNFCAVVSGGTLPAFSRVRKLGKARNSRSFEVPVFFPLTAVLCASLLSAGAGAACALGSGFFCCPDVPAGLACVCGVVASGDCVCWAAEISGREEASKKTINGRRANFIGNHFSWKNVSHDKVKAIRYSNSQSLNLFDGRPVLQSFTSGGRSRTGIPSCFRKLSGSE